MNFQFRLPIFLLALCFGVSLLAQDSMLEVETLPRADRITTTEPVPKKSPMNSASMHKGDGYVRVVYSQPMLRGRAMLGDQVAYGKVWRAGANEATEIFTTQALDLGNGKLLSPGAYSLFVIPQEGNWTVVFNEDLGQWGAYSYDEAQDALRVDVPVKKNRDAYEAYTMFFEKGNLVMAWGTTRVELPMTFAAVPKEAKMMDAAKEKMQEADH